MFDSKFFLNIVKLISGSAFAQLLILSITPLLTRIYEPNIFGIIGVITAISSIGVIFVTGRYELSFITGLNKVEVYCATKIIIKLSIMMSCILFMVGFLLIQNDAIKIYIENYIPLVAFWFLPLFVIFGALNVIFNHLSVAVGNFGIISITAISGAVSYAFFALILGLWQASVFALIFSQLALVATKMIIFLSKYLEKIPSSGRGIEPNLFLSKFSSLPKFRAPNDILSSVSQNSPLFILGYFYGAEVAGFFWLCIRVLRTPASLIGDAIKKVVFNRVSELGPSSMEAYKLCLKIMVILLLVTTLPNFIFIVWGEEVFVTLFGNEWIKAGKFSSILILWVSFIFINIPSVALITCNSMHKFLFIVETTNATFRIFFMTIVSIIFSDDEASLLAFVITSIVFNLFMIVYVFYKLKPRLSHR